MSHFDDDFKRNIVRLHIEGRSLRSLSEEYGVSKASISNWSNVYSKECQTNPETNNEKEYLLENRKLKQQLAELEKENNFLKKAAAFFAKEID